MQIAKLLHSWRSAAFNMLMAADLLAALLTQPLQHGRCKLQLQAPGIIARLHSPCVH
jgi:hypothetical protein